MAKKASEMLKELEHPWNGSGATRTTDEIVRKLVAAMAVMAKDVESVKSMLLRSASQERLHLKLVSGKKRS